MANETELRRYTADEQIFSGGILYIGPGNGEVICSVHRDLICTSSKWLERINPLNFTEFTLQGAKIWAINSYISWLYTGTISSKETSATMGSAAKWSEDPEYGTLAELYNLGKRVEDDGFTAAVTDAFITKLRERKVVGPGYLPGSKAIDTIFTAHPSTDPMARLILDSYVKEGGLRDLSGKESVVNPRFVQELACMLLGTRTKPHGGRGLKDLDKCDFHQHAKGVKCDVETLARKRKRGD
ncbi:hypothetical protein LTR36_006836 [Oleoguttula mirabilis]|uniref:BTB domain-containing protein n=1 Tax=Oleoguttula mirabilis TaxID=1507867 RepID=A0AAV9JB51_9PEZI|nr:hypothetical protein LTR36_006836 [Oleoguttula mirabilis]